MATVENNTSRAREKQSAKDGRAHKGDALRTKEVRDSFSVAVICPACIKRWMGRAGHKHGSHRLSRQALGSIFSTEKKKFTACLKWVDLSQES